MNRVIGMLIGVGYIGIASYTFRTSQAGWAAGHTDVGFWWLVVTGFITIAMVGIFVGTWIHTQPNQR